MNTKANRIGEETLSLADIGQWKLTEHHMTWNKFLTSLEKNASISRIN
jgi:hypothetical protein